MKKKLKIAGLILLVFIALFYIRWGYYAVMGHKPTCPLCGKSHVIHNYYRATGIDSRVEADDVHVTKEIYGEPIRTETELVRGSENRYWVLLYYDGFSIIFQTEDHEQYKYCGFELYSPKIIIRRDIHVGSTRSQIIHAYRLCPSINDWKVNGDTIGDYVCDTGVKNDWSNFLQFKYDENDIVTCIRYLPNR